MPGIAPVMLTGALKPGMRRRRFLPPYWQGSLGPAMRRKRTEDNTLMPTRCMVTSLKLCLLENNQELFLAAGKRALMPPRFMVSSQRPRAR